MSEAKASDRVQISQWLDRKDDVNETVRKRGRKALQSPARNRVNIRFGRHSAGEAFGGIHCGIDLGTVVTPGNLAHL
jgi:hypothetical protein